MALVPTTLNLRSLTTGINYNTGVPVAHNPLNNEEFLQGKNISNELINLIGIDSSDKVVLGNDDVDTVIQVASEDAFLVKGDTGRVSLGSVTGGLNLPVLTTTNRDELVSPTEGLIIWNTSSGRVEIYDGSEWTAYPLSDNVVTLTGDEQIISSRKQFTNELHIGGSVNTVGITPSLALGNNISLFTETNIDGTFAAGLIRNSSNILLVGDLSYPSNLQGSVAQITNANTKGILIDSSNRVILTATNEGFLKNVMNTTARDAISSLTEGLTIYNITTKRDEFYNGIEWLPVGTYTTNPPRVNLGYAVMTGTSAITVFVFKWIPTEWPKLGTKKLYFNAYISNTDNSATTYIGIDNTIDFVTYTTVDDTNLVAIGSTPTYVTTPAIDSATPQFDPEITSSLTFYLSSSNPISDAIIHYLEIIVK